jgi:sporulation protein YlmC with PRC-barrel domain
MFSKFEQGGSKVDIPINATVQCANGACGRTTRVVINPATRQVTHLVVGFDQLLAEYLVPIELVAEATPSLVRLRCTREEFDKLEPFAEATLVPGTVPFVPYGPGEYVSLPYVFPESGIMLSEHKHVPPGELAVQRGAQVRATDGDVGRVDEFLIDPANEHITHLVLREGHLWGQRDVTIPVSEIDHLEEDTVYLKLDKHSIEALPSVPVRRHM